MTFLRAHGFVCISDGENIFNCTVDMTENNSLLFSKIYGRTHE